MLNGKELKNCSDDELLTAWLDGTDMSLAHAIVSEVKLRRAFRAASRFQEPRDQFPI